jgi:hypothetical protein
MRLAVFGGILLLCAVAGAQAKVYKWVDVRGHVHYSETPPRDGRATEIRVAPAPSARDAAEPAADTAVEPAKTDSTGETPDDSAKNDAFKQNCEIARGNLKVLENPAIRRFREEGKEPVYYTDEQRQARIEEAKRMVAAFCQDDDRQ